MRDLLRKNFKKILGIILLIVVGFIVFKYHHLIAHINVRRLRHYILSYGNYAALIFVVIYALKPLVIVVPASLMSILAGNLFGPFLATILSMISCFLSATLAFFIARYFGRGFVDKILKGKALNLDSNIEKHGLKIMIIMRLSLIFPYDPLSYAAGLSKMKYKDFILGTMLGVFPEMISYSYMGHSMEKPFSMKFILPILAIVAIALIASYYYKNRKVEEEIK